VGNFDEGALHTSERSGKDNLASTKQILRGLGKRSESVLSPPLRSGGGYAQESITTFSRVKRRGNAVRTRKKREFFAPFRRHPEIIGRRWKTMSEDRCHQKIRGAKILWRGGNLIMSENLSKPRILHHRS